MKAKPMSNDNDNANDAASQGHSNKPNGSRPQGNQGAPRRSITAPLNPAEIAEIQEKATRSAGFGRMLLAFCRNRNARVISPETALGGELVNIAGELDRLLKRGEIALTRNLSPQNMAKKGELEMKAAELIEQMAQFTAEVAMDFDNRENAIARHPTVKRFIRELVAAAKKDKEPAEGQPHAPKTAKASKVAARAASEGEPAGELATASVADTAA